MNAYAVDRPAEFLFGRWSLARELTDLSSGARGTVTGTVTFDSLDAAAANLLRETGHDPAGGLCQSERGRLHWSDGPPHADVSGDDGAAGTSATSEVTRDYLLLPTPEPAVLETFFDDGRPFHRLDLRHGSWQTTHACTPDHYELDFRVISADRIEYRWRVRGPAKDQFLTSRLDRL